jgi:PncC family amidohydrolase
LKARVSRLKETLLKRGLALAVAESMTGGAFSDLITSVQGASGFFLGGVISYSPKLKVMMGVPDAVLKRSGFYSEEVSIGLAKGVRESMGADIAVGITGIAHPDKGHRAPGAWIAVVSDGKIRTKHVQCRAGVRRNDARKQVAMAAIELLIDVLRQ